MSYAVENALFQWEEGEARLRQAGRHETVGLERAVRDVLDELRRRLGGGFTIGELADLYGEGTDWATDLVLQRFDGSDSSAAVNAAFLRYARDASDYAGGRRHQPEEQRAG